MVRSLSKRHMNALGWFARHAGTVQPWPKPLRDGTLLATKAKGIYKPEWSEYALTVKQTLDGRYPDHEPVARRDGTWTYSYCQEGKSPADGLVTEADRDAEFTNRGLMACLSAGVPVGVIRQTKRKPNSRYQVLGLATVQGWSRGWFHLRGLGPSELAPFIAPDGAMEAELAGALQELLSRGEFDPTSLSDERKKVLASIVRRQGQPAFRNALLIAYEGQCAISNCSATQALEAAHIVPFLGPSTNSVTNGLLLRSDIHTLFDLQLISICPDNNTVWVSPLLDGTEYATFRGTKLRPTRRTGERPSRAALARHWKAAGQSS